jgi:hypothetical protein
MEALADAKAKLLARGEAEARELTKILEDQRKRVTTELKKHRDDPQGLLKLGDNEDEVRQRNHDIKYWEDWLQNVDGDLQREPARIREFYSVRSFRIEPVGLVYLIPA